MPDTARWRLALEPHLLSLLRLVVGLLYLQHGLNKLFDFPSTPHHNAYHLLTLVPGLAGPLETIGGFLVTIGLYTRIAAFILSGEMAFAYFMAHAPRSPFPLQNGGEPAVLFCFTFLYLVVAGAGFWSIDRLRARH
ncbi:MAG: DoxX family protein [Stellaceae bacterium]